jgi:hypothetical protein
MIIACQGDISKEYQQDFLTTEDVVPIFLVLRIKQHMADFREIWILNMMEVDDDAKRLF